LNNSKKIIFLTLKVFAATGGIEKVCRVAGKALHERAVVNNSKLLIKSMYDKQSDADENKYFPSEIFSGFGEAKISFIVSAVRAGIKADSVILSHINLLLVGWLIKKINPKVKLILFAHGIEIWGEIGFKKKQMLPCVDVFLPVSNYTADKIRSVHNVSSQKIEVINNCLDPFMPLGKEFSDKAVVREKYGFKKEDIILFTLSRLSSKERYKGYDKVLEALVKVKQQFSNVKYLIAGSYDVEEKRYIDEMSKKLHLEDAVVLSGFVPEEDLVAHFSMADIYVMPSMKEGFGIVFIEAMFYGLPVIAGNKDGSVDALRNGELGTLVDPLDVDAIEKSLLSLLYNLETSAPDKAVLLHHFSFTQYKRNLERIIKN
jgi:glycosyltransferase involved in cell wall biosynthesis